VVEAARIELSLFIPAEASDRRKSNITKPPGKIGLLSSGSAHSPGTELEDKRKTLPEKQG
jgi:hypothetical protein